MKGFTDLIKAVRNTRVKNEIPYGETARILRRIADRYERKSNARIIREVDKAVEEEGLPFYPKEEMIDNEKGKS